MILMSPWRLLQRHMHALAAWSSSFFLPTLMRESFRCWSYVFLWRLCHPLHSVGSRDGSDGIIAPRYSSDVLNNMKSGKYRIRRFSRILSYTDSFTTLWAFQIDPPYDSLPREETSLQYLFPTMRPNATSHQIYSIQQCCRRLSLGCNWRRSRPTIQNSLYSL